MQHLGASRPWRLAEAAARARRRSQRCAATAAEPPLPLCERAAVHEASGAALLAWAAQAEREVSALGPSGHEPVGDGSSGPELQRELTWLLEDALGAWRPAGSAEWQPAAWALRKRELGSGAVRLRAPLPELSDLVRRRLGREPLQYLLGCAHWRDLVLAVGPGVLIPRPETELLTDLAAAACAARPALAAGAWADVGTGSGALALSLARSVLSLGAPPVAACDVSPVALAYTALNARRLGLQARVTPVLGDWLSPLLAARGPASLAGILSNPPYIPRARLPTLQPEVGQHEPWLALDGGEGDGGGALETVCAQAATALAPGGFLGLETDGGAQAERLAAWLRRLGGGAFSEVAVVLDCYGEGRFVTATRTEVGG